MAIDQSLQQACFSCCLIPRPIEPAPFGCWFRVDRVERRLLEADAAVDELVCHDVFDRQPSRDVHACISALVDHGLDVIWIHVSHNPIDTVADRTKVPLSLSRPCSLLFVVGTEVLDCVTASTILGPLPLGCRAARECHRRIGVVGEVSVSRSRSEALRRLRGSVEFGGCSRGDVLGSAVRRPLIEAFADPATTSRVFGLRGAAVQDRWSHLVSACADSPTALGFVQVDGSMRNLANRLGVDDDAFLRNLRTWGAKRPPIVVVTESKGAKGKKASVVVQVPLLSAWLLWTADARSVTYRGMQGFIGPERIRQVAVALIAHGDFPPAEKALLPLDADRLIRLASSR